MKKFDELFTNNQAWIQHKLAEDPKYFKKLSLGQKPEILYIGCSDSRVAAEEFMGLHPGEIFVHRNVANLVISTDNNINAVIQYAVERLKVRHIIVCGHYQCGGVEAAMYPSDMGQINSWLQTLRDVIRIHHHELNRIRDPLKRYDRLVELNVIEQCINLLKIDHVQKSIYNRKFPMIHGLVFDMRTGLLKDLRLNVLEELGDVRSIYDLKMKE